MAQEYDFQYLPLTGELPGAEFERQTEQAINELGATAYEAKETAENAISIATDAQNTALEALEAAQDAQAGVSSNTTIINQLNTSVTNLENRVTTAEVDISGLKVDVQALQTYTQAIDLKATDSANAIISINNVIGTLQTEVTNAGNTANTALGLAEDAQATMKIIAAYDQRSDVINLDDFTELARIYIKNSSSLNIPITQAGLLDVDITDAKKDEDASVMIVRQQFLSLVDYRLYYRSATVTYGDSTTIIWGGWITYNAYTKTEINELIDQKIETSNVELKSYIDRMDYLNVKPKIGFYDDDCYANIFGSFPFSARVNTTVYPIHDNMDREVVLFSGNDGVDSVAQVYAAYRMNDNQDFTFLAEPLRPSHLTTDEVMWTVLGLSNEGIFYIVQNTITGTNTTWFAKTDGSVNPVDWYDFVDITSILSPANWINLTPIYVPSEDVMVIIKQSSYSLDAAVYKMDLSVIKDYTQLVYLPDIIDRSDYDASQGTFSRRGRVGAFYDEDNEQLNVFTPCYIASLQVSGSSVAAAERFVYTPFRLSNDFLQTSGGTATLLLEPLVDYNWMYLGKGVFNNKGAAGTKDCTVVADIFKNVTYFCYAWQHQTLYFNRFENASGPEDANAWWGNPQVSIDFLTPDVCPWAKEIMYYHHFMNGILYGYGNNSKKYGNAYYATELEDVLQLEDYFKFKVGTWWLPAEQEDAYYTYPFNIYTCYYRVSENEVKWYYASAPGTLIREITVEDNFVGTDGRSYKGRRTATSTGLRVPTLPSGYTWIFTVADLARNIIYFGVQDTVSADTSRQGYVLFLVYDMLTETFTEIRDVPDELDALCKRSYDALNIGAARAILGTSAIIDTDGSVSFGIYTQLVGDRLSNGTFRIDRTASPKVTWHKFDQKRFITQLGYDSKFGYFGQVFDTSKHVKGIMRTSKNPFTGEEKTREQFFDQDEFFTFYIGRDTGIGLVAYDLGTTILVGGYVSTTPESEIYPNPNAVNYIYYSRDSADREKVNIEVQKKKIGGEKAFNRVLVTEITTDHEKIIAQKNYAVKWDY